MVFPFFSVSKIIRLDQRGLLGFADIRRNNDWRFVFSPDSLQIDHHVVAAVRRGVGYADGMNRCCAIIWGSKYWRRGRKVGIRAGSNQLPALDIFTRGGRYRGGGKRERRVAAPRNLHRGDGTVVAVQVEIDSRFFYRTRVSGEGTVGSDARVRACNRRRAARRKNLISHGLLVGNSQCFRQKRFIDVGGVELVSNGHDIRNLEVEGDVAVGFSGAAFQIEDRQLMLLGRVAVKVGLQSGGIRRPIVVGPVFNSRIIVLCVEIGVITTRGLNLTNIDLRIFRIAIGIFFGRD